MRIEKNFFPSPSPAPTNVNAVERNPESENEDKYADSLVGRDHPVSPLYGQKTFDSDRKAPKAVTEKEVGGGGEE